MHRLSDEIQLQLVFAVQVDEEVNDVHADSVQVPVAATHVHPVCAPQLLELLRVSHE
jgi:hypothetical protein